MKNILGNIRNVFSDENITPKKTLVFFAFYLVFFAILFGIVFFGGDKDFLNFVFDYKITIDGVLYDYYGKRYEDTELFKYNNLEYYRDGKEFFVNQELWMKSDNPYKFYELIDFENASMIFSQATFDSKKEMENEKEEFHYLISSNTLNQLLYNENTDYDEEVDSIDVTTNSDNYIEKIVYHLDHFCVHRENCQNTLMIEMSFEMFNNVQKIDNPIQ